MIRELGHGGMRDDTVLVETYTIELCEIVMELVVGEELRGKFTRKFREALLDHLDQLAHEVFPIQL